MATMTNKQKATEELRNLDDQLEESILNASDTEVSEELSEAGIDPLIVAGEMDAIAQEAKAKAGKSRLAAAKEASAHFRARMSAQPADRSKLRAKLERMRSASPGSNDSGSMMAARKGKEIGADDEEGALDDLAQLDALESKDGEASKE
jgi:hypothetical protein